MATKITCAAIDCVYCNEKCRCTADKVCLSDNYVMTMYDGRQHFNTCKTYQKSDRAMKIESAFRELLDMMTNGSIPQYPTESTINEK